MLLFLPKINPFSSFTIGLGPIYVERVFDSLLLKQGTKQLYNIDDHNRYEQYLDHLEKWNCPGNKKKYEIIQFYKGYFSHQLANHLTEKSQIPKRLETALHYYQSYVELANGWEESRYYAEWQTGVLRDILHYPWSFVEMALVSANRIDPLRGEATKSLIDLYIRDKKWQAAYSYSSMAFNKFFDKNPIAIRRWFIECDAYDWNVMKRHLLICYKLHYSKEVQKVYDQLLTYLYSHLDEFDNAEIRHIHRLERFIRPIKRTFELLHHSSPQ